MRMVAMDEKDFGARCAVERDAHDNLRYGVTGCAPSRFWLVLFAENLPFK